MRRLVRILLVLIVIVLVIPVFMVLCLRWINPPTTAFMLETGARVERQNPHANPAIYQHWVDIGDIDPAMALAAVAGEDQTFPYHHGFVWPQIENAVTDYMQGQDLRGASSITQQTAKNLFLWPAQNFVRKGIEAYFTVWMELLWPKRRILEMYLNIAQFSDRIFGVGAAARRLFGVSPGQLSRRQAALLAASLPAPDRTNYANPSAYMRQRQQWILGQMQQLGYRYLYRSGVLQQ